MCYTTWERVMKYFPLYANNCSLELLALGVLQKVYLIGGYYGARDNIKSNFLMAFATMLAWRVIDFGWLMGAELRNTIMAVKWGTYYLLKASTTDAGYVQLGDPISDHNCWERPEDMDMLRTVYKIDQNHPGSDVA